MNEKQIWRVHAWFGSNIGWLLYILLSTAVLLQQFPATEPLVLGFWWISVIAMFVGAFPATGADMCKIWTIYWMVAVNVVAIIIQILLVMFCWEQLLLIDEALRSLRGAAVSWIPGATHLLPGRLIWLALTAININRVRKDGWQVFNYVGPRPW